MQEMIPGEAIIRDLTSNGWRRVENERGPEFSYSWPLRTA